MAENFTLVEQYESLEREWKKLMNEKEALAQEYLKYYLKKAHSQEKQIKSIKIEFF